ncbi:mechanosensitive ion channel family protein [Roseibium sp.]|uniref:mechanosensitive ion channel family protein n=1 Tax=Roseibium sp. TaxID=1936156 RepID=UPI003A975B19
MSSTSFSIGSRSILVRSVAVYALVLIALLFSDARNAAVAQGIKGLFGHATSVEQGVAQSASETAGSDDAVVSDEAGAVDQYAQRAALARDAFLGIVRSAPELPAMIVATLSADSERQGVYWIGQVFLVAAISIAVGLAAQRLVSNWGRAQFTHLYREDVLRRSDKISYLFFRALVMIAGLVVFALVSGLLLLFLNKGGEAAHKTGVGLLSVTTLFLFLRIVFLNLLAPDNSAHRLVDLSDANARGLYRSLMTGALLAAIVFAAMRWMDRLGLPEEPLKLMTIGAAFLSALILSSIALSYRHVIGDLIRGEGGANTPIWRRFLAKSWHLIAVLYFLVAWGISSVRVLLDLPDATGLVVAPLEVLLIAVVAYGIFVLIIDKMLLPPLDTPQAQASIAEEIVRAEVAEGDEGDAEGAAAQVHAEAAEREAQRSPFRDLLDHGASIIVMFGAFALLARTWGAPLTDDASVVGSLTEILLVIFLGYMAYRAVELAIERQLAKEGPAEKDEEAEVGGTGESRISTLLPIFRNFLLITIVVIAAMVVLSELGVNIGPLFAGAGVVGLAVGFGAQTLIRDIFSGAFYLIDDAFRKGEYIDIGSAKGVVEKISIRSMQLRHHRGALTTVPFGEIQHVENYSRDWAMMKLAFRVTYDTDVEKMRKIIKKFGQELLADEYYGPMFLQPLKSQGILAMEDSAMIARVKFMTKPGKQFELRKVVYAGLQDLFEQNGIKFAHKQVTVRVASDDVEGSANGDPDLARKAAAGAAAAGLIGGEADGEGGGDNNT